MHPILADRRRLRVFLAIWIPLGLLISVLPYWWMGGALAQGWPVVIWGELFAIDVLASWSITRYSTIDASVWQILTSVVAAAIVTTGLWIGAGRFWFAALASFAPAPAAVFTL